MALILSLTEKQKDYLYTVLTKVPISWLVSDTNEAKWRVEIVNKLQKGKKNETPDSSELYTTMLPPSNSAGTAVDQPVGDSRSGPDGYSDHSSIGTTSWKD